MKIFLLLVLVPFLFSLLGTWINQKYIEPNRRLFPMIVSNFVAQYLLTLLILNIATNVFGINVIDLSGSLVNALFSIVAKVYVVYVIELVIIVYYLFIKRFIHKVLVASAKDYLTAKSFVRVFFVALMYIVGIILIAFTLYFVSTFGNISPEQALYNLQSPMDGIAENQITMLVFGPVINIIVPIILFVWFMLINVGYKTKGGKRVISHKINMRFATVFSLLVLCGGGFYFYTQLKIDQLYKQLFYSGTFYGDNYIDPRNLSINPNGTKRNVIHIFLESMENTYLSKDLGGACEENLMPQLTKIAEQEGVVFSNTDYYFGGPQQTFGSGWSAAGMVNTQSGVPLKVAGDPNAYGKEGKYLPGLYNMGDILHAQGYNQSVMFGADADYAGLSAYYKSHGDFNILDEKWAKEEGLIPQDYRVMWGFEDEKLWPWAVEEINRLASEDQPFNFVMETGDTHFPNGYNGPNTPQLFDQPYANPIHFSDDITAQFIRWCQQQPWYENTTIIVNGDHLSMDTEFFKTIDPNYNRTFFNMIINPAVAPVAGSTNNRQWAPLDYFPTILSAMGYDYGGNRAGLGTNLFSGEPTLMEQMGFQRFDDGLRAYSKFYENVFLQNDPSAIESEATTQSNRSRKDKEGHSCHGDPIYPDSNIFDTTDEEGHSCHGDPMCIVKRLIVTMMKIVMGIQC